MIMKKYPKGGDDTKILYEPKDVLVEADKGK